MVDSAKMAETVGTRGYVPENIAEQIRELRSAEPYLRYDSIVVGQGARTVDPNWFDNFADFANSDSLLWFGGRGQRVGQSYSNQIQERTDYAQDFYQFGVQFLAPTGFGQYEDNDLSKDLLPQFWIRELANAMSFSIRIAQTDTILVLPGPHAPPGVGQTGAFATDGVQTIFSPGGQGDAHVSNSWKFPRPLMLPAKATIEVRARIDEPVKSWLQSLPNTLPGVKNIPVVSQAVQPFDNDGNVALSLNTQLPNWFVIKPFFRGPRYVQLRGAREAR